MSVSDQQVLYAILRRHFASFLRKVFHTLSPAEPFIDGWPIEAIAHQLERVARGETRRLIINLPPRSLKSIAASVSLPLSFSGISRTGGSFASAMPATSLAKCRTTFARYSKATGIEPHSQ